MEIIGEYQEKMKKLEIPYEFIPILKKLQEEHSEYEVYDYLKRENAVQMFTTLGIDLYLTFDGRVIVGGYTEDREREAKNFAEVAMAMVLGAKARNCPELLELLPKRTENDVDCKKCNKSDWLHIIPDNPFVCDECGGLGWRTNKKIYNNS